MFCPRFCFKFIKFDAHIEHSYTCRYYATYYVLCDISAAASSDQLLAFLVLFSNYNNIHLLIIVRSLFKCIYTSVRALANVFM